MASSSTASALDRCQPLDWYCKTRFELITAESDDDGGSRVLLLSRHPDADVDQKTSTTLSFDIDQLQQEVNLTINYINNTVAMDHPSSFDILIDMRPPGYAHEEPGKAVAVAVAAAPHFFSLGCCFRLIRFEPSQWVIGTQSDTVISGQVGIIETVLKALLRKQLAF